MNKEQLTVEEARCREEWQREASRYAVGLASMVDCRRAHHAWNDADIALLIAEGASRKKLRERYRANRREWVRLRNRVRRAGPVNLRVQNDNHQRPADGAAAPHIRRQGNGAHAHVAEGEAPACPNEAPDAQGEAKSPASLSTQE